MAQPSLAQPALAIQHPCSHTDISATQITCCARHLLAVHGIRKRQADHKAGGDCKSLRHKPTGCYTGTRASGFPLGGRRVLRLDLAAATRTRIFACPRRSRACGQDFQTPRDACENLLWAGRSTQAASTAFTSICARTRAHTHTHAHARASARARARIYARTRAHVRTPAHTHTRSCARKWRVPT